MLNLLCPCGSSESYANCCGLYHADQAIAPTAEALMRSRFSAFAKGELDYLLSTLHPSKRKRGDRLGLAQSLKNTRWIHLQILAKRQGQPSDRKGIVEFMAVYDQPQIGQMHERSRFVRETIEGQARWFYVDGDILPPYQPKRNQPCWCQSGKAFKRCHGKK